MSIDDLSWSYTSTAETIYDPALLTSTSSLSITITNYGIDTITDIGLYITPSTAIGDVDYPSDFPPETDYQDIIRWGEEVIAGVEAVGGFVFNIPQNDGTHQITRVSRNSGYSVATKLPMKDLAPNESAEISLSIETPPSVSARRLYVSVAADISE